MSKLATQRRVCVVLDLEKYSSRPTTVHERLQERLRVIVEESVKAAGQKWDDRNVQEQGDGLLLLLPPAIDEPRVIPALVNRFCAGVDAVNLRALASHQMRFRMALCQGAVSRGRNGWIGDAVIRSSRLVDSPAARAALDAHPDRDVALIVADDLFTDVIAHGHPGLDPRCFHKVHTEIDGKGFAADAWVCALEPDKAEALTSTGRERRLPRPPNPFVEGGFGRDVLVQGSGAIIGAVTNELLGRLHHDPQHHDTQHHDTQHHDAYADHHDHGVPSDVHGYDALTDHSPDGFGDHGHDAGTDGFHHPH